MTVKNTGNGAAVGVVAAAEGMEAKRQTHRQSPPRSPKIA